jgi:tripartite-type tricarboxylate transporter receptor subunit TctC
VAEALKLADVSKQLVDMSMEAVGGTPAEMAQYLREESRRWGAVIRQSGARAD